VDYPADFSCGNANDNDETNPKAQCQDGIDNDSDGLIDFPNDPGCSSKQDNNEFTVDTTSSLAVSCVASPNSVNTGQSVNFVGSVTGGTANYTYLWTGGCTGSGQTCTNTFSDGGNYRAILKVTSGNQVQYGICSATVTKVAQNNLSVA